jgi:hypothetical protein
MTVPWIVLASNVITVLDEAILWLGNKPAGRAKTRRMPVQPLQNIPDSPDISLNDVSFTSMTVHMEVTPPKECYEFRRFLGTARRCHG